MDRKHMAVLLTVLWLVAAGVIGFAVRPAVAAQQFSELSVFPPDVQAELAAALSMLPPIQRQMHLNAIAQLSPAMVTVYTQLIRGITLQQLFVLLAQISVNIGSLPLDQQQAALNYLWGSGF